MGEGEGINRTNMQTELLHRDVEKGLMARVKQSFLMDLHEDLVDYSWSPGDEKDQEVLHWGLG